MPSTKQVLELYQNDYVNSIKRNLAVVGEELKARHKKKLLSPTTVELFAQHGLSIKSIANLLGTQSITIQNDPEMLAAFEKGRANIGSVVRAAIIDDALNKDLLTAKLYLDKVFNKEDHVQEVNLNISQTPLENIPTEQLLEFDDGTDPSN
jgi:transcriptional regulator with XRE-family HTH domain